MKHLAWTLALALFPALLQAQTLNITSAPYNATTGSADNAAAIQAAINAVGSGGTVLVPSGTFLSGPITLKSNMTLQLASGSTLKMTAFGTFPQNTSFVYGTNLTNLTINGSGTMDGQGAAWWTDFNNGNPDNRPPAMIYISKSSNVTLTGITVKDSPKFHIQTLGSMNGVYCAGLSITAAWPSPNTDGIDLRGKNYLIENCYISDGDDVIQIGGSSDNCQAITIRNCTFGTGHGLSIGGYTQGGVSNLLVDNCTFNGTQYGIRWKTGRDRGGTITNLTYSNITMTNILLYPFFLTSFYPNPSSLPPTTDDTQAITSTTPFWSNITLRNITASTAASGAKSPGILWAVTEAPVSNVLLDGVTVTGPSGKAFEFHHARGVTILCNCRVDGQAPPTNIGSFDATITYPPCGSATNTFTFTPTKTNTPVPPTNTPTRTATGTASATRTNTPANTPSATPSRTPTASASSTPTATRSNTPSATASSTPSSTATKTNSPTATATSSFTNTQVNTPSSTATRSNTPSATASSTPSSTATRTNSPTATPTSTTSATPSSTRSSTPTGTATATAVITSTPSSTLTATFSATDTKTSTLSATPTLTASSTPTKSNTPSGTASFTATLTSTSTPTLTYSATPTISSTPTVTSTSTDTSVITPTPSSTPTMTSSFTSTATTTATKTYTFSNTPSSTPTATNTATSTASPTSSFTPTVTSTSTNTAIITPTPSSTSTRTHTPSSTSSATPSVTPSNTYTPTLTLTNSPVPTQTFTRTFTPTSTATSTWTATGTSTQTAVPPTITPTAASGIGAVLYPNPVTGDSFTIQVTGMTEADKVQVQVETTAFRVVNQVTFHSQGPGTVNLTVPATDSTGVALADGAYYVILRTQGVRITLKLMVLR